MPKEIIIYTHLHRDRYNTARRLNTRLHRHNLPPISTASSWTEIITDYTDLIRQSHGGVPDLFPTYLPPEPSQDD